MRIRSFILFFALITLVPSCFDWDDNSNQQNPTQDHPADELEGVVGPRLKTLFEEIKAEPQETPDGEEILEDFQIARLIVDPYAARAFYHTPSDPYIYRDILKTPEKSLGVPCGVSSGTMFAVYANDDASNIHKELQHQALNLLREKLEGPESTVLRVELGCHSFVIHKEDDTCHVIQSWIEGYDIDNNLNETFTGRDLFRKIYMMITTGIQMGTRGYRASIAVFHGPLSLTGYQHATIAEGFKLSVEAPRRTYSPERVRQNFRHLVLGNLRTWKTLVNNFYTAW